MWKNRRHRVSLSIVSETYLFCQRIIYHLISWTATTAKKKSLFKNRNSVRPLCIFFVGRRRWPCLSAYISQLSTSIKIIHPTNIMQAIQLHITLRWKDLLANCLTECHRLIHKWKSNGFALRRHCSLATISLHTMHIPALSSAFVLIGALSISRLTDTPHFHSHVGDILDEEWNVWTNSSQMSPSESG